MGNEHESENFDHKFGAGAELEADDTAPVEPLKLDLTSVDEINQRNIDEAIRLNQETDKRLEDEANQRHDDAA